MSFKNLFFAVLLGACAAGAQVRQSLRITQLDSALKWDIEIQNDEKVPQSFTLFSDAHVLSVENLQLEKQKDGSYLIWVGPRQQATIHYTFDVKGDEKLFLTDEKAWHPLLQSQNIPQIFSVSSDLKPGYELINSATGQNEDSLALVWGAFKKYETPDHRLHVYLYEDDATLAKTLLDHLSSYMKKYESDIGPYPYDHFSVVECPDEVGYAFPKMTWIGTHLLRYPFILNTSLPHELLHSWWGNGVFVDYEKGNWCEGLTVMGADYGLLSDSEKRIYRLKTITSYLDFAKNGKEIPLTKFVSRGEDPALQAIGYGKALMVFIMLEQQIGETQFKQALRLFYNRYKFQTASYDDFFSVMEEVSHQDLSSFKENWIHTTGLIQQGFLKAHLEKPKVISWQPDQEKSIKASGQTVQTQFYFDSSSAFQPVTVKLGSDGKLFQPGHFEFSSKPISYSIDPNFLLFRDLSDIEKPRTFSELFAAKSFKLMSSNDQWTLEIKKKFKDQEVVQLEDLSSLNDQVKDHYMVSLQEAWKNEKIRSRMQDMNISLEGSHLNLEGHTFDISQDALFLNVRLNQATVTVFSLNDQLPLEKWLQRWSYYSSESYLVLGKHAADLQGMWIDEDRITLQ